MPAKGPVPKRSTQRLGHRTTAEKEKTKAVVVPKSTGLAGPPLGIADPHPLMRDWYDALRRSGQAEFLEPSDWAQARIWVQVISAELDKPRPSAVMIATWVSDCTNLMTTEGSRRRMRMELERVKAPDADQTRAKGTVDALLNRLTGG